MNKAKILALVSALSIMILSTGCNCKKDSNMESNKDNFNSSSNSMIINSQKKVGKYTIANNNVPLKRGKPNDYCFSSLVNEAYVPQSSSLISNADTVNGIYPIEELRNIKEEDTYYCIFESEYGEYMYIFFNKHLVTIGVVFSGKILSFKDFENIEINKSSSDDVARIDPASSVNSLGFKYDNNYGEPLFMHDVNTGKSIVDTKEGSTHHSYHLTKEGYVKVKYKTKNGKLIVTKVAKKENKIIQGINSLDWPS